MNKSKLLAYAFGPIGSGLVGFVTLPLMTWFYSAEDIGRVSMLQVCSSFAIILLCLGLDQAYGREYHESKNKPALLKVVLLPSLLLSIFVFLIIFFYDKFLISEWLYGISSISLSVLSIICMIAALITRFFSIILRMQERALAFSMSQLLPKILFLIFILGIVLLDFTNDSYSLITVNTLSVLVAFIIYTWNTRKDWLPSIVEKFNYKQFKIGLMFGLPLVFGGLASWVLNMTGRLFLRALSGYSELGIFSVAMSIASAATIFASIFNTIWSPLVFKWVSEGKVEFEKIDVMSEYVLAAIYFIVVSVGLFSWILPFLLPKEYAVIQYLLVACLLGPLFYTLSETTSVGIAIVRKTKFSMIASITAMLINIVVGYFLIFNCGAAGAAISTALAFWCFYVLRTEFSKRIWRDISVKKSYLITSFLLFLATINVFIPFDIYIRIIMWGGAMLLGFYIFRDTILKIFNAFGKLEFK